MEAMSRAVLLRERLRPASLRFARGGLRRLAHRHPAWVADVLDAVVATANANDDAAFLDEVFQTLLGRPIDPDGRRLYAERLATGLSREEMVILVASSEEYKARCRAGANAGSGSGPRFRSPERYRLVPALGIWTFPALGPSDFDWIEAAILADGYYERPGVWTLEVDTDKRVMAEIVATLSSGTVLEFGCASGAVLEGLHERGLSFEGVDISTMAIAQSSERVRPHIHHGDLLSVSLGDGFDAAFGLDIFEHLNPNRLPAYLERLRCCLRPGGLLYANVPAFGNDEVFGEVFSYYLRGWDVDAAAGRCFSTLHVDGDGYPIHGHLIWADTTWWVAQFESAGFVRQRNLEAALHDKYDEYMAAETPARRSFYVLSAGPCSDEDVVLDRIKGQSSTVLTA